MSGWLKNYEAIQKAPCNSQRLLCEQVRTDCREMLRTTAMLWERAVVRERQALQDARMMLHD